MLLNSIKTIDFRIEEVCFDGVNSVTFDQMDNNPLLDFAPNIAAICQEISEYRGRPSAEVVNDPAIRGKLEENVNGDVILVKMRVSDIWYETEPFDGRHYDINNGLVLSVFDEAQIVFDRIAASYEPAVDLNKQCSSYGVLRALDELGHLALFQTWEEAPERTFKEKLYVDKSSFWDQNDPTMQSFITFSGLTEERITAVWTLGQEYHVGSE